MKIFNGLQRIRIAATKDKEAVTRRVGLTASSAVTIQTQVVSSTCVLINRLNIE